MANPRLAISREGNDANYETYKYDTSIIYDMSLPGGCAQVGLAVALTGNSQVGLALDGKQVLGKLILAEHDGNCTVMVRGYSTALTGIAATLTPGQTFVGAIQPTGGLGGAIRDAAAATLADVAAARGWTEDTTTPAAVMVHFGS